MRPEAFDDLTRQVGRRWSISRRRLLQLVAVSSVAAAAGVNTLPLPARAARPGCGVRTIVLWMNAFIPGDFPPVRTVPLGSPYAGFSMIDGPLPGISDCFLTDQRGFDDRMNSAYSPSSRVTAWVNVDLENATILNQVMFSYHTVEVDCEDGDVECDVLPQPRGPGFHNISRSGNRITLQLRAWAHDPCFENTPGFLVPDVDVDATITIDVDPNGEAGVTFDGRIDVYPAYEIYVMPDGAGDTMALLQRYPNPGTTPGDLALSDLAVPVFAQARLSNTNSCSAPNQVCCMYGTGNDACCPDYNPVCCPNDLGGACCPEGMGCCPVGVAGELYCCTPGWSCCGDTALANNGCCPPGEPLCCPLGLGGGCCPTRAAVCCPSVDFPFCCPEDHPICVDRPGLNKSCARPRRGLSVEQARATGAYESVVRANVQSNARGDATAGKGSGGRPRVPSIPRPDKSDVALMPVPPRPPTAPVTKAAKPRKAR